MRIGTLLIAAATLAVPASAVAASYSGIVSFGDSLSDPGNVSIATLGALPGPGYATRSVPGVPFPVGYYTNPQSGSGPAGLWIDQLAVKLGQSDPLPFLAPAGGTNFAIGSATTSGAISMDTEVGLFLTGGPAPSTALYTLWGGANDIFSGMSPTAAADTIANEILALHAAGANNFLWLNLPLLGDTPGLNGNAGAAALANLASAAFDTEWASKLTFLQALGINVTGLDINALFNNILANPAGYGFTDVTSACNATAGCDPNTFLYWDTEHPTTYADSLVASAAFQALTPTPEPPSVVLIGLGGIFVVTGAFARRRHLTRRLTKRQECIGGGVH
jgi:phospholipase/lecithinase/hemolysin